MPKDSDIVAQAKEEFEKDCQYWEPIYNAAREDLYFLSDKPDAQWTKGDLESRKSSGRPALTIDQLGQYVNQVVNDIRKNTPTIEVVPDTDGQVEEAEIRQDLIRDIMYNSTADTSLDVAAGYAVRGSIGFVSVDTDYQDSESLEQQLKVCTMHDPLSCYLDRNSKEVDGSDAKHGFILDTLDKETFKKEHKGKEPVSFTSSRSIQCGEDEVVVAEYYKIETKEKEIGLTLDGQIEEVVEGVEYRRTRKVEEHKVKRYLLSGEDVLESSDFAGRYIPIIPVFGNQMWVDGEREITSLIRRSKDAQRMFNYWKSLETELLQQQPRASYMAAAGQVEDFAEKWENPSESPVLTYNATDIAGNPVPPPIRVEPPQIPVGIVQASRSAVDDIKATIGMYAASLGQASNEVSGIAIQRRNEEGDTATYHFSDNLSKSISHLGRILDGAIPTVYDTPRTVSLTDKEGVVRAVGINGLMLPDQEKPYYITKTKYKTKVITGPSSTTQRQEAARLLEGAVAKNPDLWKVVGDLLFKNLDVAGAEAMAERMKRYIDPVYQDEAEEFDPEKAQMQEMIQQSETLVAQLTAEIEDLTDELRDKKGELIIKAKSEENKKHANQESINIDLMRLEAEREKADKEFAFKMEALALKQRELDMKEREKLFDVEVRANQPESVEVEVNN